MSAMFDWDKSFRRWPGCLWAALRAFLDLWCSLALMLLAKRHSNRVRLLHQF